MADRRLAWALVAVIVRYLTTIQPQARRELARWRQHALAIPDPELRAHVLRPFDADGSALGASLFAVLAPLRMQRRLVRLLIAYVLLWSYVDVRTERDPDADPRLYDVLVDALRPGTARLGPIDPYDGGYLTALMRTCRCGCAALPRWGVVRPAALRIAENGRTIQAINHGQDDAEARLRAWARNRSERPWFEQCAAASSPLVIHALMALAACSTGSNALSCATSAAYEPVSALGVVCDHLIDEAEDWTLRNHSYLQYVETTVEIRDLCDLADCAVRSMRSLPAGNRHTVILAAMTAMFLSNPSIEHTQMSRELLDTIGRPSPLLRAIFRISRRLSA